MTKEQAILFLFIMVILLLTLTAIVLFVEAYKHSKRVKSLKLEDWQIDTIEHWLEEYDNSIPKMDEIKFVNELSKEIGLSKDDTIIAIIKVRVEED